GDKIRSQSKPFLYLFQLVAAKDPVHEVLLDWPQFTERYLKYFIESIRTVFIQLLMGGSTGWRHWLFKFSREASLLYCGR
ncbi:hypothetical protein, partial [Aeromonas veronii]|uniref:hypothetical protein n=1 Tax=Aeromonas veronii TaxID=654 RepID=UPI003D229AC0